MQDETAAVFAALADPTRRALLDRLFERDGQTQGELLQALPMTRFGVMKHLAALEEAGLITTHRAGREKFHYLNPVPIQLVYDRWVSKFAAPWTGKLSRLKYALEAEAMAEQPAHIYQIFINASLERVWAALTEGDLTVQYYYGSRLESSLEPGSQYRYAREGAAMIEGQILACEPRKRLVTTFRPLFSGDPNVPETKVTYELEERDGGRVKLTLTHEGLEPGSELGLSIQEGWAEILSAMKTLVEKAG